MHAITDVISMAYDNLKKYCKQTTNILPAVPNNRKQFIAINEHSQSLQFK